jgi:glycosyltransferase involved in cell wall biosynthesis
VTPIRVVRVIARMNVGGPALQVSALTTGLPTDRFEQHLLVGSVDKDEADYLDLRAPEVHAVRVAGLGRSPNPLSDLRALREIRRVIRDVKPHIVHTHTAKAGVLGRAAAGTSEVPARVHTFHGHLLHGYFSPAITKAVVVTERALAKRTTKLVAVGAKVRDELLAAGIGRPDQYVVVPPGVELPPAPSRADARAQLGLPEGAPVIAFVARLTRVKRPDRLADVARRVVAARPDAVFIVAGEGDLLDELRSDVAGLGDRVRFLGWRRDVETVYAASDLVVLTSDNEGMPVSLIEAASVGCPAVTTAVGSAHEVVIDGKTGFVVDRDAAQLAEAVVRVVEDATLRDELGRAAAQHAHEHFSRARLIDDTAALYEQLAGNDAS